MTQPSKFQRMLRFFGQNEGLAICAIVVVVAAAACAMVLTIMAACFTVEQVQCSRMCSVSHDVGMQTDHGCVCTNPDGDRWVYPINIFTTERASQ